MIQKAPTVSEYFQNLWCSQEIQDKEREVVHFTIEQALSSNVGRPQSSRRERNCCQ